jgi:hypothetical protein
MSSLLTPLAAATSSGVTGTSFSLQAA